ncbi:hypothetical protein [Nocardia sp. CY41]|uniref:hypothetical protein n=1 Tax=Nocardia sp. CY41 TaxID=2608686 RepID=UPI001358BD29|nr:hypothetical protein [Nocardia sp. CY41]
MNSTTLPVHPIFGPALGLRRNGAPIWAIRGASPEGDPPENDPVTPDAPATDPKTPDATEDTLGDAGKKALAAERAAKRALSKERDELAAKVKQFEDRDKSDSEKQADRIASLEKDAADAKVLALRYKYAAKHQISDEDAELFLVGTDEETIAKQAQRLAERGSASAPQPGTYVPGEGRTPATPNLDEQIAEAQKNRDFTRAIALKQQRSAQQRQTR